MLEHIFQPEVYPHLYGDFTHGKDHYYLALWHNKEGWDNIDFRLAYYKIDQQVLFRLTKAAPFVLTSHSRISLSAKMRVLEWLSLTSAPDRSGPLP